MNMKKISIILVILWMVLIFYFSSMNGVVSTSQSEGLVSMLAKLINYTGDINTLRFIVRKCAHIGEYFILGILVYNMFKYHDVKNIVIISILICIIYACTDEIHQLFISDRTGKLIDVFIDSLGSILGIYSIRVLRK